jgi:hypothetical protein
MFMAPLACIVQPNSIGDTGSNFNYATPATPSPTVGIAGSTHSSSIIQVSSHELISQQSSLTNCLSTPTFSLLSTEDVGDTDAVDDAPLPDWFSLGLDSIDDNLNPRTKAGTIELQSCHKRAVDC